MKREQNADKYKGKYLNLFRLTWTEYDVFPFFLNPKFCDFACNN